MPKQYHKSPDFNGGECVDNAALGFSWEDLEASYHEIGDTRFDRVTGISHLSIPAIPSEYPVLEEWRLLRAFDLQVSERGLPFADHARTFVSRGLDRSDIGWNDDGERRHNAAVHIAQIIAEQFGRPLVFTWGGNVGGIAFKPDGSHGYSHNGHKGGFTDDAARRFALPNDTDLAKLQQQWKNEVLPATAEILTNEKIAHLQALAEQATGEIARLVVLPRP